MIVHRHLKLRDPFLVPPRHRHQGPLDWQAAAIGITFVEAEARFLDGAAENIEREHGAGQEEAAR